MSASSETQISPTVAGYSISKTLKSPHSWTLDGSVFLILAALILYTVSKHEPWADEAETWVEVRDIPWFRLLFSVLRYDGHLPLWHAIVWIPVRLLHMPYTDFGFVGALFAIAGLAVLIWLAPFPRILRYLIAGSFFFVYQYAVVARPYVLMPLLGFLAAHFYRQGVGRIIPFAVASALLIQDSTYAAVMSVGLSAFYALQARRNWTQLSRSDRNRVFAAIVVIAAAVIFAVIILYPKSDSSLMGEAVHRSFSDHLRLVLEGMTGAFAETKLPAIGLLLLTWIWAWQRRASLLLLLMVGGTALEYGFVRGYGHHQGLITIAFVVFLWATWPTIEQLPQLSRNSRWVHHALLAVLVLVFAWHCRWSYGAIRSDWARPYSGALDAANYLKLVHADERGCSGYLFWAVAVQPYFDHNIFLNYGGPSAPASYYFSVEFSQRADILWESQALNGPPFIVVGDEISAEQAIPMIQSYRSVNYILVHYSDGTRFFKGPSGPPSSYFIFERLNFLLATQEP